jgi:flagellar basal-body rod protein FlgB
MSSDLAIEATRLALGMQERLAQIASTNIATAGLGEARAKRLDFSGMQSLLDAATSTSADGTSMAKSLQAAANGLTNVPTDVVDGPIEVDAEVADMVAAGTRYQGLTEGLSRHFSLMRLAIMGRG